MGCSVYTKVLTAATYLTLEVAALPGLNEGAGLNYLQ